MSSNKKIITDRNVYQQSARLLINRLINRLGRIDNMDNIREFFEALDIIIQKYDDKFFIKYYTTKSKFKMLIPAEIVDTYFQNTLLNELTITAEQNIWIKEILELAKSPVLENRNVDGISKFNLIEYFIPILKTLKEQYLEIELEVDTDLETDEDIFARIEALSVSFIEDRLMLNKDETKFLKLILKQEKRPNHETILKIGHRKKIDKNAFKTGNTMVDKARIDFKKALFKYELEKKINDITIHSKTN